MMQDLPAAKDGSLCGSREADANRPCVELNLDAAPDPASSAARESSLGAGPAFSNLNPLKHLSRLIGAEHATVVVTGPSTATAAANALSERDTLYGMLKTRLREENAGIAFTFQNLAIGGTGWSHFNSVPPEKCRQLVADWYTEPTRAWIDYVAEKRPDVVFICGFDLNDSAGLVTDDVEQAIAKIRALPGAPDVVLATNFNPTSRSRTPMPFWGETAQDGRDFAAGFIRTYALCMDLGLLDFHRAARILRDGFDPAQTALEEVVLNQEIGFPYVWPAAHACRDFAFRLVLPRIPAGFWDPPADGADVIQITTSPAAGQYIGLNRSASGQVTATAYYKPGTPWALNHSRIDAVTGGSLTLHVEMHAAGVKVTLNGAVVFDGFMPRHGRRFQPVVRYAGANPPPGPLSITLWAGRELARGRHLTNEDVFGGADNGTADTAKPWGGNTVNHPSSRGARYIYSHVLENTRFGAWMPRGETTVAAQSATVMTAAAPVAVVDASESAPVIYLPRADALAGRAYRAVIHRVDGSANRPTVGVQSGDTIAGSTSYPLLPGAVSIFESDGATWRPVGAPLSKVARLSGSAELTADVDVVLVDASAGNTTFTLPRAFTYGGYTKPIVFRRIDRNARAKVTIVRSSTDTIDGGASTTLSVSAKVLRVLPDGVSAWYTV